PILTGEESFNPEPFIRKEVKHEPEPTPEVKIESRSEPEVENEAFPGFDESSDDEASDVEDTADEIDDSEEVNVIESKDLSGMKLVELREVAKARGVKGFSRLKKAELLELLSS
ncbi:Rho-N domain-containing protein 1, chloroplastic, partial [Tanacetum coccineum]